MFFVTHSRKNNSIKSIFSFHLLRLPPPATGSSRSSNPTLLPLYLISEITQITCLLVKRKMTLFFVSLSQSPLCVFSRISPLVAMLSRRRWVLLLENIATCADNALSWGYFWKHQASNIFRCLFQISFRIYCRFLCI